MKIVVAMMKHETNTFSPVPTRFEDFGPRGPLIGQAAYDAFRSSGLAMAGLLAVAEEVGAEIQTPVAARANPSAPVQQEAFEHISEMICEAVDRDCDALFLDLHGAMVTEAFDDGEGELLSRLRRLKPGLPIAAALDFHANLSTQMVDNCTTLVGYKTYPHLDMIETGRRAGELLMETMHGRIRPTMSLERCALLPNLLRMVTETAPMRDLVVMAHQAERHAALAVTVFGGFPLADTPHTGLTVVSMTDDDLESARQIGREICDAAWARREQFAPTFESLSQSIRRAKSLVEGPILLIDHADNCNSGGTLDSMTVLAEALQQGLDNVAAGPICDPEAVAHMVSAGVRSRVELPVGGKSGTASSGHRSAPLHLQGIVRTISDGRFVVRGPVFTGTQVDLGRTVVLDTGNLELIVSEARVEPVDLMLFRFVGMEPTEKRDLVLKSKVQYQPTFGRIATHVVECNGTGFASLDFDSFTFRHLSRPIYPIDR
jgi:microcystin degradation protein MlrC